MFNHHVFFISLFFGFRVRTSLRFNCFHCKIGGGLQELLAHVGKRLGALILYPVRPSTLASLSLIKLFAGFRHFFSRMLFVRFPDFSILLLEEGVDPLEVGGREISASVGFIVDDYLLGLPALLVDIFLDHLYFVFASVAAPALLALVAVQVFQLVLEVRELVLKLQQVGMNLRQFLF